MRSRGQARPLPSGASLTDRCHAVVRDCYPALPAAQEPPSIRCCTAVGPACEGNGVAYADSIQLHIEGGEGPGGADEPIRGGRGKGG